MPINISSGITVATGGTQRAASAHLPRPSRRDFVKQIDIAHIDVAHVDVVREAPIAGRRRVFAAALEDPDADGLAMDVRVALNSQKRLETKHVIEERERLTEIRDVHEAGDLKEVNCLKCAGRRPAVQTEE